MDITMVVCDHLVTSSATKPFVHAMFRCDYLLRRLGAGLLLMFMCQDCYTSDRLGHAGRGSMLGGDECFLNLVINPYRTLCGPFRGISVTREAAPPS